MASTTFRYPLCRTLPMVALSALMALAACGSRAERSLRTTPPENGSGIVADTSVPNDDAQASVEADPSVRVDDDAGDTTYLDASAPVDADASDDVQFEETIAEAGIAASPETGVACTCTPAGSLCKSCPCCAGQSLTCNGNGVCGNWGPQ